MAAGRMLLDCGDVRDNKRGGVRSSNQPAQHQPPTAAESNGCCSEAEAKTKQQRRWKRRAGSDSYLDDVRHVRAGAPVNLFPPGKS